MKQSTTHWPTSHLVRLYTALSLAARSHDFSGQCLLWRLLSSKTYLVPTLGFTTNLGWGVLGSFQLPQSTSSPEVA